MGTNLKLCMRAMFFIAFFIFLFALYSTPSLSAGLKIQYDYSGSLGIYGIADTATAYLDGQLVAKAKAIRIIKSGGSGANQLEVEETQYSSSGGTIYRGRLIFRFSFPSAYLEEEEAISGTKKYNVFTSWPSGN